jgi:6-phosphogluconolactonase
MTAPSSSTTFAYVGTYTSHQPFMQGRALGIYVCRLNRSSGVLELSDTTTNVPNPSFLALHPSRPFLYAVNELPEVDGRPGGAVSAFSIDPASGALQYLNRASTGGAAPCHLSVDRSGRFVLAANYGGGSVAVLPILDDGRVGPATAFVQHQGSSVNPRRQEGPHAHAIIVDLSNRFALACDLGIDKVLVYRFDPVNGTLAPNDPPWAQLQPGSGPRHLEFHPNGRYLYVINELGSTVTVFAWDGDRGALKELQTIPTLPEGFTGTNHCADIHVHPSGQFVYGSNRGHDSIVIYAVDAQYGTLTLVGHEPTQGRTPRNFALDPAGTFLFAANQATDTIVTFRIDAETGRLSATGHVVNVPSPVCVRIMP